MGIVAIATEKLGLQAGVCCRYPAGSPVTVGDAELSALAGCALRKLPFARISGVTKQPEPLWRTHTHTLC